MRAEQFHDFRSLLSNAMAFYGKDLSNFALDVWWQACQGYDLEQVAKAMTAHATDPERGQFAPKPADVVRALAGTATDRSLLAWGKTHEAMSSVGAYTDVVFDDPAIHAVVEDLGGWPKLCRADLKELGYLQHRFCEAHRAYTQRGEFAYPRRLMGDRSPDHEYKRFGRPVPKPAIVGDKAKAALVYQGGSAAGKTAIGSMSLDQLAQLAAPAQHRMLRAA